MMFFNYVEFQQHNSPYIHGLLWLEDVPKYGHKSEDIFVCNDKIILCSANVLQTWTFGEMSEGMFSAPWPPMPGAVILEPLDVDENAQY